MTNETSIRSNNYWIKHYAKLDYWTPEEAVSLACNLNPQNKRETVHILKVAGEDVPLMILLSRAIECHTIKVQDNKIKPLDFIKWCKSKDISFPRKLEVLVRKFLVSEDEDLEVKYQKLETENNNKDILIQSLKEENREYREKISYLEKEVSPAHGNSLFTCYRIIFLALREAYDTGNREIKEKDLKRYTDEFITSIELLRDNADIKLPFPDIPHMKTINSTFQDMIDKFYKNNKHVK